jgi:putative transcriptional regulator
MIPEHNTENLEQYAAANLKRLGNGCVLFAKEALADPNFARTVVLICVHNADGAYGLVLNRPSHMPLSEVFEVEEHLKNERRKLYIGGPVQTDALNIIQITDTPVENILTLQPRVHVGGQWDSLDKILDADRNITRLYLGYSGWAGGQLEGEIIAGAWDVYHVDLAQLVLTDDRTLCGSPQGIRELLETLSTEHA